MSTECFELQRENGIAHLHLNQPQRRNAMTAAFWDDLPAAVAELDRDGQTRALVISSSGPHFSAGIDLSLLSGLQSDGLSPADASIYLYQQVRLMQQTFSCLEQCRFPVLAAIQGGAIGGAVDFVTACDMRYASANAFFCIEETNVGMTADVGTFPRLLNLLPEGVVRELAYTGRRLSADEALQFGLVNAVLDDSEALLAHVMEVAARIAAQAPAAVHGCKRTITWSRDHNTEDGLEQIALWNAGALNFAAMGEAITARKEKRVGRFADLPPLQKQVSAD